MSDIMQVADGSKNHIAQEDDKQLPANNGKAIIKVIGIGGGGGSTVQHMIDEKVKNVEFIAVNTDLQALNSNLAEKRIQIGVNTTRGLGSGSKPEVGRAAAEESREDLKANIGNADIVFITAGMGGGTGTGASPIVANICRKELGALTVAIVTKPFSFEGVKQCKKAEEGISKLSHEVDALIVIPNDKLLKNLPKNVSLLAAFQECNHVLKRAVKGISDIISSNGYINVDFNDIRTILAGSGSAIIGMGSGDGENAPRDAVRDAINCPLLDDMSHCKARGVIANFGIGPEFPISDYANLGNLLNNFSDQDTDVKLGITVDENLKANQVNLVILLTGLKSNEDNIEEQNGHQEEDNQDPNNMGFDINDIVDNQQDNNSDNFGELFQVNNDAKSDEKLSINGLQKKDAFESDKFDLPDFLKNKAD